MSTAKGIGSFLLSIATVGAYLLSAAAYAESSTSRTSSTTKLVAGSASAGSTLDQYGSLVTKEAADQAGAKTHAASGTRNAAADSYDFWFYDVDVALNYDQDRDGYFTGIDLNFDVDTLYRSADIYAVVYLSYEGGPWNEYAVSDDFTIYDSSFSDDYTLVTDLVSGYPTGHYDLLIEIFDAWTGEYVAGFGPADTSALSFLPLEDLTSDNPGPAETRVTVTSGGGGGSAGIAMLMAMAGLGIAFRRSRQ